MCGCRRRQPTPARGREQARRTRGRLGVWLVALAVDCLCAACAVRSGRRLTLGAGVVRGAWCVVHGAWCRRHSPELVAPAPGTYACGVRSAQTALTLLAML